jgi:prepilin-type N-terminal cleavage/methylation domain-containing protein
MPSVTQSKAGFTMIELLIAMTIFSFMLLIVASGFIDIVRMQNQSLASNMAQDSARSAMDELVQAVRNSTGVVSISPSTPSILCLANSTGVQQAYYVNSSNGILYRSDDCTAYTNTVALTSAQVQVSAFTVTVETSGPAITVPEVEIAMTVASNNGSTNIAGNACKADSVDRQFCSIVTLTSGAVPR